MKASPRVLLWRLARMARQIAGLLVLVLGVGFFGLTGPPALRHFSAAPQSPGTVQEVSEDVRADERDRSNRRQRELLDDVEALAHAPISPEDRGAAEPVARLHSVFVDLGPERSEVSINGRWVGRVPYAGQWSCVKGEELVVLVLPPEGASTQMPIQRKVTCHGGPLRATAAE